MSVLLINLFNTRAELTPETSSNEHCPMRWLNNKPLLQTNRALASYQRQGIIWRTALYRVCTLLWMLNWPCRGHDARRACQENFWYTGDWILKIICFYICAILALIRQNMSQCKVTSDLHDIITCFMLLDQNIWLCRNHYALYCRLSSR